MVSVTVKAAEVLSMVLKDRAAPKSAGFRLTADPLEGYTLVLGPVQQEDQVVEHDGEAVFMVGADIAGGVDRAVVGAYDSPQGPVLSFNK